MKQVSEMWTVKYQTFFVTKPRPIQYNCCSWWGLKDCFFFFGLLYFLCSLYFFSDGSLSELAPHMMSSVMQVAAALCCLLPRLSPGMVSSSSSVSVVNSKIKNMKGMSETFHSHTKWLVPVCFYIMMEILYKIIDNNLILKKSETSKPTNDKWMKQQ